MATNYCRSVLRMVVAQLAQSMGWHAIQSTPIELLTDILERYVLELANRTHRYSEQFGRTDPNLDDLGLAFQDAGINLAELTEYVRHVDPIPFAKEVPQFPVPKPDNLNFPNPSSREILERDEHIHEYLPPMHPEMEEEVIPSTPTAPLTPGLPTTPGMLAVAEESTMQISPGPGGEKRPFSASAPNSDQPPSKRPRILPEEAGHSQYEMKSMIMTHAGFLTPTRQGILPDARTPPPPTPSTPGESKRIPRLPSPVRKDDVPSVESTPPLSRGISTVISETIEEKTVVGGRAPRLDDLENIAPLTSTPIPSASAPKSPRLPQTPKSPRGRTTKKGGTSKPKSPASSKSPKRAKSPARTPAAKSPKRGKSPPKSPKLVKSPATKSPKRSKSPGKSPRRSKSPKGVAVGSKLHQLLVENEPKMKEFSIKEEPPIPSVTPPPPVRSLPFTSPVQPKNEPPVLLKEETIPSPSSRHSAGTPEPGLVIAEDDAYKKRTKEEEKVQRLAMYDSLIDDVIKQSQEMEPEDDIFVEPKPKVVPPLKSVETKPKFVSPLKIEVPPIELSPTKFSPRKFSPGTFSPTKFSPTKFSPTKFSPTNISPTKQGSSLMDMNFSSDDSDNDASFNMTREMSRSISIEDTIDNVIRQVTTDEEEVIVQEKKAPVSPEMPTLPISSPTAVSPTKSPRKRKRPKKLKTGEVVQEIVAIKPSSTPKEKSKAKSTKKKTKDTPKLLDQHKVSLPNLIPEPLSKSFDFPDSPERHSPPGGSIPSYPPSLPLELPIQTPPPVVEQPPLQRIRIGLGDGGKGGLTIKFGKKEDSKEHKKLKKKKKNKDKDKDKDKEKRKEKNKDKKEKSKDKKEKKQKSKEKKEKKLKEELTPAPAVPVVPKLTFKFGGLGKAAPTVSISSSQSSQESSPRLEPERVEPLKLDIPKLTIKTPIASPPPRASSPLSSPRLSPTKAAPRTRKSPRAQSPPPPRLPSPKHDVLDSPPSSPEMPSSPNSISSPPRLSPSMSPPSTKKFGHRSPPPRINTPPPPPKITAPKVTAPKASKSAASKATAPKPSPSIPPPPPPSTATKGRQKKATVITETVGKYIDPISGETIWICPSCKMQDDGSPMIGCDICDDWYHWVCVGITEDPDEDQWFCVRCNADKGKGLKKGARGRPPGRGKKPKKGK